MNLQKEIQKEAQREKARRNLVDFILFTKDDYEVNWHHNLIADKLQNFLNGEIKKLMLFVPPQNGKFLPSDTPVLTTKGWKKHIDLNEGDYVFGQDGDPKKVLGNTGEYIWNVTNIQIDNGVNIEASNEHLWKVLIERDDKKGRVEELHETQNILKQKNRRNPAIQISPSINMPERDLLIDPYILGCWLGDGTSAYGAITVGEQDIHHFRGMGKAREVKPGIWTVKIDGLTTNLRKHNLIKNKHIPIDYLLSSQEQRMELLRGLMDTDGHCDKNGRCEFSQKEGVLSHDVYKLIRSLGYKTSYKPMPAKLYGRIVGSKLRLSFTVNSGDIVFKLKRKQERIEKFKPKDRIDKKRLFITNISGNRLALGNCIEVEGGMYLAGFDLIPTHNSELASRRFPAYLLGKNPNLKIVCASYSHDLAASFNRDVQRIIDDAAYYELFPETTLGRSNVKTSAKGNFLRNADEFEIVGKKGSYKSVGVCGGLTGRKVDIAIIDDPVKDSMEANSAVYRDRVWDWYMNVLRTRLHNDSQELLIMTRWHEDDLAGRLLERENNWDVVSLPAIAEEKEEFRHIGEALWPERHSLERMLNIKELSPRTFTSLYQQRPSPEEGDIIKKEWFDVVPESSLPFNPDEFHKKVIIDGAFTDKTKNDESAVLVYTVYRKEIYILQCYGVRMELNAFLNDFNAKMEAMGVDGSSLVQIELKASGIPIKSMLSSMEHGKWNCVGITNKYVSMGKMARVQASTSYLSAGKIHLVKGNWNDSLIEQCAVFPNGKHDDKLDTVTYATLIELWSQRKKGAKFTKY